MGRPLSSARGKRQKWSLSSQELCIYLRNEVALAGVETNTRKIVARLKREGWVKVGGDSHDKFEHPDRPEALIVVPRHRNLKPGTARGIAKDAGWIS